jgi:hypothetical protein
MASLMLVNPKSRRKSRKSVSKKRRSPRRALSVSTTTRKSIRRYRRNPIRGGGIAKQFTDGAMGAGGALLVDVLMSKLPIPAQLTSSPLLTSVTKGFVGIGAGMLVAKVARNKKLGDQLAGGAVTIALYNAGRGMIGPSLGLSGSDDGLLGWDDDGLLGFSDFDDDVGMGYINPEPVSDWGDDY